MDLFVIGELLYQGEGCGSMIVDNNIHFINSQDQSQLVIGESAMSCIANQVMKSDLGKLHFNEDKFNQFFKVKDYHLNTTSLSNHIKLFEQKMGKNHKIKVDVEFSDINIEFGKYDVDVAVDYDMCMKFRLDLLGAKELLYDCLHMSTSMNVRAESEILHIEIIEHKLNLDTTGANRQAPKRNSMDMTANEYREFLEDFSFTAAEFKKWMNDVVLRGNRVVFPYSMDEFETFLRFENQKMHLMIDIEDKAYVYLEKEYWVDE